MINDEYWRLVKQNISDPVLLQKIEKGVVKKSRTIAVVLGSFLIVSLIAVVYAFVQTTKAQVAEEKTNTIQKQLDAAIAAVQKQEALAIESKMIAEEAAKVAYEELEKCRKKK